MKKLCLLPFFLLLAGGCQNQDQETQLRRRETDLASREQKLLLRENELILREQRLAKATQVLDSTRQQQPADSVQASMLGTWATRMECIETDCQGSAIGDGKNEEWQISYVQNAVLVKASVNNKVVRVYSGAFNGNTLELTAQHPAHDTLPDATITVQLQRASSRRLEGRREISRPDNCRIVYALALTKGALLPVR
jgi:hypothetical protein